MGTPGEKISLDEFLDETSLRVIDRARSGILRVREQAEYLLAHSRDEPQISAQLHRLIAVLPDELAFSELSVRNAAIREADTLRDDIKQRWINADAPPLVDKIDEILADINVGLNEISTSGSGHLHEVALRIDRLTQSVVHLDGVEQKFIRFGWVCAGLFLLGLMLLMRPDLTSSLPLFSSMWTSVACLAALPLLGVFYAARVLPRSRVDAEIQALNLQHFAPLGGIYFAAGSQPACIIRIDLSTPSKGGNRSNHLRDPRKERTRLGGLW